MNKKESTSSQRKIGDFVLEAVHLDRVSCTPLFQQLYSQIRELITSRALVENTTLPSTRMLAADLTVSRNTVIIAYEQLETEGYIETARGSRARVATLPDLLKTPGIEPLPELGRCLSNRGKNLIELKHQTGFQKALLLQPGLPDARDFPFPIWRRLFAEQLHVKANETFGYHSHGGDTKLREIIAKYMSTSRGLNCQADQVMVTTGAQGAFNLLARLLLDQGDRVMIEEPGYTGARGAFLAAGAHLAPLRVTGRTWNLDDIENFKPKLIYVTPSCQFPLGTTMRIEQRLELLKRANTVGAWVIEDDFDSEFSFLNRRLPTLQFNDPLGRTIYVGSFSKSMLPDLRLGFVIIPGKVTKELRKASFFLSTAPSLSVQGTLAKFISGGFFARHTRSLKRTYDRRRQKLVALISEILDGWLVQLDEGNGLQTVWQFIEPIDDVEVAKQAVEKGLGPTPLSIHFFHGSSISGLMIGYASTDESRYAASLYKLRNIIEKVAR